jgi:trimeric autotransporter adhesin
MKKLLLPFVYFVFLYFFLSSAKAQTYNISTMAGNGTAGYFGDGGAATSAELSNPYAVALDASGNVYIVDLNNNVIRKVIVSTGIITTIAGNGTGGDGGPAYSAALSLPQGIAVDASGNVYIAEAGAYSNRIRMITVSTGIITTIAGTGTSGYSGDGGPATSAELNYPSGVAVDASGNIYIADNSNQRVRKVTAGTGIITTIAGTGTGGYSGDGGPATSAKLFTPNAVAVDASGNVYIADWWNQRIRKITASTGIITTIAGTGTAGYSGDGGPATSAELYYPNAVTVDASENVYIADTYDRILKVTTGTGIITSIAGNGTGGYSGDGGPATSAKLDTASGVAVDASGNVYIAAGNNRIRKLTVSTATGIAGPTTNTANLNVYPNPASDVLNISGNGGPWQLLNVLGEPVLQGKGTQVNVQGLTAGQYILNINDGFYKILKW